MRYVCRMLLICASLFTAAVTPASESATEQLVASAQQIDAATMAMRRCWYQGLSQLAGELPTPPRVWRLHLSEALANRDLHLELIAIDGHWAAGLAWSPDWNTAVHRVRIAATAPPPDPDAKTWSGELALDLQIDALDPIDAEQAISASLSLEAQFKHEAVTGRYRFEIPGTDARGRFTGTRQDYAAERELPPDLPRRLLQGAHLHRIYDTCHNNERTLRLWYGRLRALRLHARGVLTDFAAAHAATRCWPLARPAFGPRSAQESESTTGGADIDDALEGLGGASDLGDLGGAGEDLALGAEEESETVGPDPRFDDCLAVVTEMADLGQAMLAAARSALDQPPAAAVPRGAGSEDPEFGPWFGWRPLPRNADNDHLLPADAGAAGIQDWPYITAWHMTEPLPRTHPDSVTPTLPECFAPVGTAFLARHPERDETTVDWIEPYVPPSGIVRPPSFKGVSRLGTGSGMPDATFYCSTTIHAPRAVDLWLASAVADRGRLWLNGELLAVWPEGCDRDLPQPMTLCKARFRKGANRLVLRVDHQRGQMAFWVRVCTRGAPRSAEEAATAMAAVAARQGDLRHRPSSVNGWLRDGSGTYPDATPITAWDIAQGINVQWVTPLPPSKAAPLIVGDRVYTMIDPCFLVCLDKHSGEVRWEQDLHPARLADPDAHAQAMTAYAPIRAGWRERIATGRSPYLRAAAGEPDDKAESRERDKRWNRWFDRHVRAHATVPEKLSWGTIWSGHTFPTPITDGEHIWVKSTAGATACFELDGELRWLVQTPYVSGSFAHITSPVLVDGKLIMQIATDPETIGYDYDKELKLLCLDAATGETLWWSDPVVDVQGSSTPRVLRLTDGDEAMAVVVTGGGGAMRKNLVPNVHYVGGGSVVRVADGAVLIRDLGVDSGFNTPTVVDDVVYHFGGTHHTAMRLLMRSRDQVGAQRLWMRAGQAFDGGLVHHQGLLHGQGGGQGHSGYRIYHADTGASVRLRSHIGRSYCGTRAYIPTTIADNDVFIGDMGSAFGDHYYDARPSALAVIRAGADGCHLADNLLDHQVMAPPVFEGERIYVRSDWSLMCLGPTGPAGRVYEAQVNARNLLPALDSEPPPERPARRVEPIDGLVGTMRAHRKGTGNITRIASTRDRWSMNNHRLTFADWMSFGPFPAADRAAVRSAVAEQCRALAAGEPFSWNGTTEAFTFRTGVHDRRKVITREDKRPFLDLTEVCELAPGQAGCLISVLELPDTRTWRIGIEAQGDAALYIGGQQVVDHDRLTLPAGRHLLYIDGAGGASDEPCRIQVDLLPSDSLAAERAAWAGQIARHADVLERIVSHIGDTPAADKARALLAAAAAAGAAGIAPPR